MVLYNISGANKTENMFADYYDAYKGSEKRVDLSIWGQLAFVQGRIMLSRMLNPAASDSQPLCSAKNYGPRGTLDPSPTLLPFSMKYCR
jgi:hypothetical protein